MSNQTSENNKRIAKNTLLLYFRMLFMMAISLYTSRVVLSTLGETDYGIYNVVGGFVSMFAIISGAMTTATQRFLSFEIGKKEKGNITAVFTTAVMIHIFLSVLVLIFAETFGLWFLNSVMNFPHDKYIAANWVFEFSVITFIINVISIPYNAALIAYEKMSAFAYVSIIEASLKLLIVYLLIATDTNKLVLYAALLASVSIIIRIIYGIYVKVHFPKCHCTWVLDKGIKKNMFSFVSWNLIGSITSILKEQGINVVLNVFFGATVNAARAVAYQVSNAVSSFIGNFQLAMNPQIVKLYAQDEKKKMFELVFRGAKYSFMLLLTLSIPIIIEAPYILSIWLKKVPDYTVLFLRIVLLTALVDSMSHTVITAMQASGKLKLYQVVIGGILVMTIPISYVFLKMDFPPYAALMVSLGISVICHFVRLVILNKTIGLPIYSFLREVSLRALLISCIAIILPLWIYKLLTQDFVSFILVCFISVISTVTTCYIVGMNRNERITLTKYVRNIKITKLKL